MGVYTMCAGTYGGQKKALDPPDLELHTIISCLTWVLGTELRSCGEAADALNCWSIPPGPVFTSLKLCIKKKIISQAESQGLISELVGAHFRLKL